MIFPSTGTIGMNGKDKYSKTSSSSSRSRLVVAVAASDRILLQPVLSWTSSFVVRMALVSRSMQSIHLCFGLPAFRLPGGTISRVFLATYSWSRLVTLSNHLSLAFLHASVMSSTCSLSLMSSFLTWYLSVYSKTYCTNVVFVCSTACPI